jgi:predicted amidohydrolase YtcJ
MAEQTGDTIYVGDIVTMDEKNPTAEALVVRGGDIAFVGNKRDALKWRGHDTVIVELGSRTLLPGFIDAHSHIGLVMLFATFANVQPPPAGPVSSLQELKDALLAHAEERKIPKGDWLLGHGYDDSMLAETRHPDRDDLDAVSTDHPIVLVHVSGHIAACNSLALERCGITAETNDPEGGFIRRRPGKNNREPNGILEEHAWLALAMPKLPQPSAEEALENLDHAQDAFISHGFTTIQEGFTQGAMLAALEAANSQGRLKADVVAYPAWVEMDDLMKPDQDVHSYRGRLRIGGVKIVLDGSPQGKTAWLSQPYKDPPAGMPKCYHGYAAVSDKEADETIALCHSRGWPVLAHTNGDSASDQFIQAAKLARKPGEKIDDRDFVMIHAQTVREDQLDDMKTLGIMPSFYIVHTFYWGDWHRESVLGPERAARISPMASALKRGMHCTAHNDTPIVPPWSMMLVWSAVNRLTRSGKVLGPDQCISVNDALKAITTSAAYQYGEEDRKGSLEVGKVADLVVLAENPFKVDPVKLRDIKILETISRGVPIYQAD